MTELSEQFREIYRSFRERIYHEKNSYAKDVEVHVHPYLFEKIRSDIFESGDEDYIPHSQRLSRMEMRTGHKIEASSPSKGIGNFDPTDMPKSEFEEFRVLETESGNIMEDVRVDETEVIMLDPDSFHKSTTQFPVICDPWGILRVWLREMKEPGTNQSQECSRNSCNNQSEQYVEDIAGRIYCSVDCLNETHND